MHPQSSRLKDHADILAMVQPNGKPRPTITSDAGINYARQSTRVQKSIKGQWTLNDKSATQLGITRLVHLKDEQSGLDADRAGYQELLRLARTTEYAWILLYAADRLARDDGEFIDVCEELLALGMRLWQYNEGEITTKNLHELAAKAYAESRKTATRVQDGVAMRAADGVKLGAPVLGYVHKPAPGLDKDGKWQRYGYTDDGKPDQYDIHPVIGPAITKLYERCAAGESLNALRLWFNTTTGLRITARGLKRLLRNEYYCGLTVGCKTRCSKPSLDGHYARRREEWKTERHDKPLTDEETWKRVQARLDGQSVGQQRAQPSRYALTGLVRCKTCKVRMWGKTTRAHSSNYNCAVCGKTKGTKMVERAVAAALADVTINTKETVREMAARMEGTRAEVDAALARARAQLDQVQEHRATLGMALAEKRIDDEQYRRGMARYDRQSDELAQQVRQLESRLASLPTHLDLAQLDIERLPTNISLHAALMLWPVERTQELYRACVKRVDVDADNNRVRVEYVDHSGPLWGPAIEVTLSRKRR